MSVDDYLWVPRETTLTQCDPQIRRNLSMTSKVLMTMAIGLLVGCCQADAQTSGTCISGCNSGPYLGSVFCNGCNQIIKIPDVKSGPSSLPAYNDRVLLWTGESWEFAQRTSTDSKGENWNILGTSDFGVSKKHPMWQSIPADPNDTPMCTGTVDGHPHAWKPKGGLCAIADAAK